MKPTERTCVVCRKIDAKLSLLRFVAEESDTGVILVFDGSYTNAGRGAYCHVSCVSRDVTKDLFKSLKLHRQVVKRRDVKVAQRNIEEVLRRAVDEVRSESLKAEIRALLDKETLSLPKGSKAGRRKIRL